MAKQDYDKLNLSDAFLFAAVLEDEESCRMILELIMGKPVPKVKVHVEHSILFSKDYRSIRLDVYASDHMRVNYNIEMQNCGKANLPQRARFHQAEMDVAALKPGEDFKALQPGYVIFICTFDPFHHKLYRYTFEERCRERNFPLQDGTCKIYLSTKGTNDKEVPKELVDFLHYVENSNQCPADAQDERIRKLHEKVCSVKRSSIWRERYMTLEEMFRDYEKRGEKRGMRRGEKRGMRRGEKRGIIRGEQRLQKLMASMIEAGEAAMLPKLAQNGEFLQQMYKKYHI